MIKVRAYWTRDPLGSDASGRDLVLRNLRQTLSSYGHLREEISQTVFDESGALRGLLRFVLTIFVGLVFFRPVALQCALYSPPLKSKTAFADFDSDVVVIDSVRQLRLLERLRRQFPTLRIVVDMDDLMSRRVRLLLENDFEVSLGAFRGRMPQVFGSLIGNRTLSRVLLKYEALALERAERRMCQIADCVVAVSSVEAEILCKVAGESARANVCSIAPPVVEPQHPVIPFSCDGRHGPLRFVFIGSDRVVQNRSSIDWLISAWRDYQPTAELVIFGKQTRDYSLPSGVRIHGFVDALSEVYDGRSVLFCPTLMAGGVKTKVLEAYSHGAPVIGTCLTFEGMVASSAHINLQDLPTELLWQSPDELRPKFSVAGEVGRSEVLSLYGPTAFMAKWKAVIANTY